MKDPDRQKPGGKSARSKKKRTKKAQPAPEQAQVTGEPVETVAMTDEAVERAAVAEARPAEPMPRVASFRERMASAMPSEDAASARAAAPAVAAPAAPSPAAIPATGIQAIANAYRDYTRKSLDDARSYAEQLSAVRSLDKAVEVQAKFAKKACETFAQDSRKIRELHRELFWQAFRLPVWPPGRTRPD